MNTFAIVSALTICVWLLVETRRMVAKKRKRFADRSDLSPDQLQEEFHTDGLSPCDVQRFLFQIADLTDIPMGKLRPADRFDLELAPAKGWEFDDGLGLLPETLQEEFGGACEDFDLDRSPTVGELLSVVARARAGSPTD